MDVDNDIFYDEIASYMPPPGDYSFEDLDEIIRSTDSHLDASLDINAFANTLIQNDFDMKIADSDKLGEDINFQQILSSQQEKLSEENETQINFKNDYHFNFSAYPSPATSQKSSDYLSSYETPARTSSPTSIEDEHFNPDDFINFLNDDDIKVDDLDTGTILKLNNDCRNTPSPTGSCTSSSGSSTSGVQSDASSVTSMSQNFKGTLSPERDDDLSEFIKFKNEKSDQDIHLSTTSAQESEQQFDNGTLVVKEQDLLLLPTAPAATSFLPITVPVLPVTAISNAQPITLVQRTIIPVQPVPLNTTIPAVNIKAPTPIKIENKTFSTNTNVTQAVKVETALTSSVDDVSAKVIPPINSKPKTIFLSSNDFKALMQKMNTNGNKITGTNGQIPKIIMKTANGKIITANKITNMPSINARVSPVSSSASNNNSSTTPVSSLKAQSLQFPSKMVKTSQSVFVKHQPSKVLTSNTRSAAVMAIARATLGHTKGSRTDLGMLKGMNDDKLLKKQLRMLKNRESASLSRKKKKEYVERLENRISNLEKENYTLKGQNSSLRSQLMAFAQTCSCKQGNVSDFILNTLNIDDKNDEELLNAIDTSYLLNNAKHHLDDCDSAHKNYLSSTKGSTKHHVKIAPKPPNCGSFVNKGFKQRMNAATVKKNIAVLFAMAFMVTLNVGNFQNYLNKSALENAIETSVTGVNEEPIVQTGRRLLWVPNEQEFHEQTNRTKRESDITNMPPPPLHFLRPVNRTTADKMNGTSAKDEPPIRRSATMTAIKTATYANATQENMRLARNLHKWIGGNDYLNLTVGNGIGNDFEQIKHFKFASGSYMDYDLSLQAPIGTKQKRKIILDSETQEKHVKLNTDDEGDRNSLNIFKPRISEEYLRLFKGIKRQDDTFYVLSFNMDHILLPASAYNKSSRPKMSLMLPAGDPSHNGDIVLMQIDCEVINTTELEIKSHIIPEKLRPSKYSANVRVNPTDVANNETAGPASVRATKPKDLPSKREETKEKPSAPRTYFMMGPKNQVSSQSTNSTASGANILKRKPTIVKLNANDSVIGSGVLNVRNSSLFSRMREIVGSQTNNIAAATDVKKLL